MPAAFPSLESLAVQVNTTNTVNMTLTYIPYDGIRGIGLEPCLGAGRLSINDMRDAAYERIKQGLQDWALRHPVDGW